MDTAKGGSMPGPLIDIPHGTQVTLRADTGRHRKGQAGVVVERHTRTLVPGEGQYWVSFPDGIVEMLHRDNLSILRLHQKEVFEPASNFDRYVEHIIYLAQTGSKAYGMATDTSDDDWRGIFLPPMEEILSLRGAPETIERKEPDTAIWEVRKFMRLALNANPNVLEVAFSPIAVASTPESDLIIDNREMFLSKRIYTTYLGYSLSQMKKLEQDLRAQGHIRWKHAAHLIRLLLSGIYTLNHGEVLVNVGEYRDDLLAIRRGEWTWEQVDAWRKELHTRFELASEQTKLSEYPDYERANSVLLQVYGHAAQQWMTR